MKTLFSQMQSPLKPIGVILWLALMVSIFMGIIFVAAGKLWLALLAFGSFLLMYALAIGYELRGSRGRFRLSQNIFIVVSGILGLVFFLMLIQRLQV